MDRKIGNTQANGKKRNNQRKESPKSNATEQPDEGSPVMRRNSRVPEVGNGAASNALSDLQREEKAP
jgi:hypothetical protein